MKKLGIFGVILLAVSLTLVTACSTAGTGTPAASEDVQAVRGDLKVTVSGSGNIAVSEDTTVTFAVSGRIQTLNVSEGDHVMAGDVLAALETDSLELAVLQAETNLSAAQTAQSQAEFAVTQAETSVAVAQFTLDRIKVVNDLEDDITQLQNEIDAAESLPQFGQDVNWNAVAETRAELAKKKQDLGELLGEDEYIGLVTYNILSQKYGRWVVDDVRIKQLQLESARKAVTQAQASQEQAEKAIPLAQKSLDVARKQLADATLMAPLTGVISSVPVEVRDTVTPVTPILTIIDPTIMELKVDVDEIDVASVMVGQTADISVDALPDLMLEGKVTSISQVPRQEGGVVIYQVKIKFDSSEEIGLKDGMSASADIIINESDNTILVPSRAVKQDSNGSNYVEVVVNGQTEKRTVTVGITDGFQTEILSGLQEGETVRAR